PDPKVNWYAAASNVDNAWRLQGYLSLVVGDSDHNVPPESTFRVVNALVQSRKDFDLLVVPNADHGAASPVTQRRLADYFRMHLLDEKVANPNSDPNLSAQEPPVSRGGGAGAGARRGGAARGARGGRGAGGRGVGQAQRGATGSPSVE